MVNSVSGNILWDRLQVVHNSQITGTVQNSNENGSNNATGVNSCYDNFMSKLQGLMQSSDTGVSSLIQNNSSNVLNNESVNLVQAFKDSFSNTTSSTEPTTTGLINTTTTSNSQGTLLEALQGLVQSMNNQGSASTQNSTGSNISALA